MADCAVFDLDGTLVNTIDDLAGSTDYTLEQYGIKSQWNLSDYKKFVGNGVAKLVERAFDGRIDEALLPEALEVFKKRYAQTMCDHAYVYDGIKSVLDSLKEKGVTLCVCTNKPHEAAVKMLDKLFGENYFDVIIGQKEGVPKKPEPHMVLIALKKVGKSAEDAIYFGDSDVDMITARRAKIDSVGVTWGFRSFAELFEQHPTLIIDEPKYILKLF